ncbi:hypothetical protein Trco_006672 [Trichoderma cornu-damae]|uniref:Uncharacterized protein n=1 Tax=Trichoderma cornu-damae TaxID=654480 RepID=A0A9P8QKU5_9HYPO|nr:hypothetical protein Trco_006672 [Trichoderma cornu-damae]
MNSAYGSSDVPRQVPIGGHGSMPSIPPVTTYTITSRRCTIRMVLSPILRSRARLLHTCIKSSKARAVTSRHIKNANNTCLHIQPPPIAHTHNNLHIRSTSSMTLCHSGWTHPSPAIRVSPIVLVNTRSSRNISLTTHQNLMNLSQV